MRRVWKRPTIIKQALGGDESNNLHVPGDAEIYLRPSFAVVVLTINDEEIADTGATDGVKVNGVMKDVTTDDIGTSELVDLQDYHVGIPGTRPFMDNPEDWHLQQLGIGEFGYHSDEDNDNIVNKAWINPLKN